MNTVHDYEQATDQPYPVPSIHRAFILLEILANNPKGLGVTELAHHTGWPKSSIYNILTTLHLDGFVDQNPDNGRYRMTIKLLSLSGIVVEHMDIRRLAYPLLEHLAEQTKVSVNLGILDGNEAIYLETIAGPAVRAVSWPGKRLYVHRTALGKALVADLTNEELEAIVSKTGFPAATPNTITTLDALHTNLQLTRRCGYALDDEEDMVGMRCIGVPIRDYRGRTVAAISITGLTHRISSEALPELATKVMETAHRISELLGYTESPDVPINQNHQT